MLLQVHGAEARVPRPSSGGGRRSRCSSIRRGEEGCIGGIAQCHGGRASARCSVASCSLLRGSGSGIITTFIITTFIIFVASRVYLSVVIPRRCIAASWRCGVASFAGGGKCVAD